MAKFKHKKYSEAEFNRRSREAGLHAILAGAVVLEREYKLKLSTPGTGGGRNWQPRSGQRYRPSAPGKPPTVQDGHLRRSIGIDVGQLESRGTVTTGSRMTGKNKSGTNTSYARHLEYGTRHMKARPWMRPVNKSKATIRKIDNAQTREFKRRMAKV